MDKLREDTTDDNNNCLRYERIFLGFMAKKLLQQKFNEGDITLTQRDKFITAAIAFYKESLRYVLTKMNVENTFCDMAKWIDFSKTKKYKMVRY